MDISGILTQFLNSPFLMQLPSPSMIASMLASILYGALTSAGFKLSKVVEILNQIGFRIGEKLLPSLMDAAKQGEDILTNWMIEQLAKDPKVNEAAAQTVVHQAETVAKTLEETHPDDKEKVADRIGQGLQAYGGATKKIAKQYAAALKDISKLNSLVTGMQKNLQAWGKQTIKAKRSSLKGIKQIQKEIAGVQVIEIIDSKAKNVTQEISSLGIRRK